MRISLLQHAHDLPQSDWQALHTHNDPFISRAFLGIAENTGAASQAHHWQAMHLALHDEVNPQDNTLLGLLPLYLRHRSFGDFSHDWNWAPAWQQAGLAYYPKLVSGVPFTPSPGPRLLARHNMAETVQPALINAAIQLAREMGVSMWQCLFVRDDERALLESAGMLIRRGVQFHWVNRGYEDFDAFLGGFTADKRKKLKRERRAVRESGLRIEVRHGDEIDASLWLQLHRHYRDTFLRHNNHPAFSLEFFRQAAAAMGQRMVVMIAWQVNGSTEIPVASAICYRNDTTLFGRHWGADIACPGLHFELCYYSGIEYAIEHQLSRFEPGAQGEHKLARGFEPCPTWSAFWVADQRLREALRLYLAREDEAMQDYQSDSAQHLPFKTPH